MSCVLNDTRMRTSSPPEATNSQTEGGRSCAYPLEFKNSVRVKMAEGGQLQQRLVSKKGKTNSVVWEQFGFEESDDEQKHATCKICDMVVAAPHGNTTNLFNHLKCNHRVTYDNLIKKKKPQSRTPSTSSVTQASITDTLQRNSLSVEFGKAQKNN